MDIELKGTYVSTQESSPDTYGAKRTEGTRRTDTRLRRLFSSIQIWFFALSYMSSWEAMSANVGLAFSNGGPRAMVWGFFIVIPGMLCQVASIAEMSSIQPIAGAQYHWTHQLAPPKHRRFITWLQGWITWFSWISLLAGVINVAANILTSLVAANYSTYVLAKWHTVLIMYGLSITLGLVNVYLFRSIPWIETLAGLLHLVLWLVFAVVLLVKGTPKPTQFVFFEKVNASGWTDDFVSFNLGIILITWGFVGFDSSIHLSEEVRKARYSVPRAIFWSICVNSLLAFGMVLIFFYRIGDIDAILSSAYPLMAICLSATGSLTAASAMIGMFLIINIIVSLGSVTSASRLTWAWSRDGALPAYFSHISSQRVPDRSVWLPIFIVMLLSLLNLANYTAFSVIISLSTFGLYQSYFIAIACMLHARLSNRVSTAPWSLGRFGVPINIFALLYSAWLGVFMVFPTYLPVTAASMNYALPINAAVWIFVIVSWYGWGRKNWKGLNKEVVALVVADAERNTKD